MESADLVRPTSANTHLFISPRPLPVVSVFMCFGPYDSWTGDVLTLGEEDKLFGFGMPRASDVVVAPPYERGT